MALTFDFYNSIIEVPAPATSVDLQTLINEIRAKEDDLTLGMEYASIANAFGKQDLGGGSQIGLTVQLLDNWKLRFEARAGPSYEAMIVTGGNLVAESGNPIAPSAYTTVTVAQSSSPTIATPESDTNLLYLVESLVNKTSRSSGSYYYWDPENGDDTSDGLTPANAVATFSVAQGLTTAGVGDTIFCMASNTSGVTTVTERLSITKNNLKIRGAGYAFQLAPTLDDQATVTISADNVEFSGMYITTAGTGSQDGIVVTGDNAYIKDCWVSNTQGNAINISSSARSEITECAIEDAGQSGTGDGILIGNSTTRLNVSKSIISGCVNGASLAGTGLSDNTFENNLVFNNSGYGITIGSGVVQTHVRSGHTFNNNTLGDTQDGGTNTYIESQAGGATPSQIADAVWDEVISGHTTAGTTGRALKDAKTRATLASLQ